jgi:pimeloyl-ACP methyl ester carboxylesterase
VTTPAPSRKLSVLVPGGSVYTCDAGGGEALLCLHGGPGASHGYLTYGLGTLAPAFRPIFFDQRGGGRSVPIGAGWPRFRDLLDDIESICEAYRLERLGLIGHSWGALLALSYALVTRREVTGVALVNALPLGSDLMGSMFDFICARTEDARVTKRLSRVAASLASSGAIQREKVIAFAHRTVPLFVRTKNWWRLPQYVVPLEWQMDVWSAAQQHVQQYRRVLPSGMLVVQGEEDVATTEEVARSLIGFGETRAVTIPRCGHVAPLEAPQELCGVLRGYFSRATSARQRHFASLSDAPRCEAP